MLKNPKTENVKFEAVMSEVKWSEWSEEPFCFFLPLIEFKFSIFYSYFTSLFTICFREKKTNNSERNRADPNRNSRLNSPLQRMP